MWLPWPVWIAAARVSPGDAGVGCMHTLQRGQDEDDQDADAQHHIITGAADELVKDAKAAVSLSTRTCTVYEDSLLTTHRRGEAA